MSKDHEERWYTAAPQGVARVEGAGEYELVHLGGPRGQEWVLQLGPRRFVLVGEMLQTESEDDDVPW